MIVLRAVGLLVRARVNLCRRTEQLCPALPTCQLTSGCKLIVSGPGVGEANSCHSSEVMIHHPHTGMLFGSRNISEVSILRVCVQYEVMRYDCSMIC